MNLKPIETLYNGYLFRSRLEARWAVFFDSLNIAYEYEKEGYDLGPAGWYLPDFWLPVQKCWVEVKGADPTESELAKVKGLALLGKIPVWLFKGPPNYQVNDDAFYTDYRINAEMFFFVELPDWYAEEALSDPDEYGGIEKVRQAIAQGGMVFTQQGTPFATTGKPTAWCLFSCSDDAYRRAFTAARSARFEHRD